MAGYFLSLLGIVLASQDMVLEDFSSVCYGWYGVFEGVKS
jgi:hypothetical protein